MPIITINLLSGRDSAKKTRLIREVAEAAARSLEAPIATVRVILNEVPPEHWGVGPETKADQLARTGSC